MSILAFIAFNFLRSLSDGCFSLREVCSSTNEERTVLKSAARCTSPLRNASVAASPNVLMRFGKVLSRFFSLSS